MSSVEDLEQSKRSVSSVPLRVGLADSNRELAELLWITSELGWLGEECHNVVIHILLGRSRHLGEGCTDPSNSAGERDLQ